MRYILLALNIIAFMVIAYVLNRHEAFIKDTRENTLSRINKLDERESYLTEKYYKIDCWYWDLSSKIINPKSKLNCN